ncbi:Beta-1,4-galactosyltransferase 2 [Merluccius polli]|uniref:Beta-1,4-galactosyltransferase 2 n=1 Tax=Merluccius polli TaxID=89951 RepID=A0AA47N7M0_MERPO|nr:Beta-1,4-galactosyltransferase 2 [Merluccius polli]
MAAHLLSGLVKRDNITSHLKFNKIQNTKNTMRRDGISSLTYRLVQVKRFPLYTNISVEIGKPPPRPFKG